MQNTIHIESINNLENRLIYLNKKWSKIYILVDENTKEYCLPFLFSEMDFFKEAEIIEIESGESNKTIEISYQIWSMMLETGADRNSLLVNLGGGVITDLGGFIASTFKRGIDFVNIPTTLLGQVDASVGGKTGVNLEGSKNQIGTFSQPIFTLIDSVFLQTLESREFFSGMGEIIKYALTLDEELFVKMQNKSFLENNIHEIIETCVLLKQNIVSNDFKENGERKKLNYGHTIGHAFESFFEGKLLHGEAIAAGMICENYLSFIKNGLSETHLIKSNSLIDSYFSRIEFDKKNFQEMLNYMKMDKKNQGGKLNFTLLSEIGRSDFDKIISQELVTESLNFYLKNTV